LIFIQINRQSKERKVMKNKSEIFQPVLKM